MAKRKSAASQSAIATQLARFVLIRLNGQNDLVGSGTGRVDIRHESEIDLETIAPDQGTPYCRVVVRIRLKFAGRREKDESDAVSVEGVYEGRFMVHPDIGIEALDAQAADERFQYGLVAQVYPLSANHLKDQLQMMGLTTRHIPIGI